MGHCKAWALGMSLLDWHLVMDGDQGTRSLRRVGVGSGYMEGRAFR